MKRTDEDRLRLFDTHVTELLTESADSAKWSLRYDLVAKTMESEEPHREALRSWLVAIRLLDAPGEDTFLPGVMDVLEAMPITDKTREVVGLLRNRYEQSQMSLGVVLEDSGGTIGPREAFELLAYAHHLHRDAAKEARAKVMGPEFWEMVRREGVMYAVELRNLALILRSVARDDPATTHLFEPAPPGTTDASG